jgi:hypothetical protein
MKYITIASLIVATLSLNAESNPYQESLDRLSVANPEFVFHLNLEDDFTIFGNFLSEAYLAYLSASPETPPVPVNFDLLFQRLGLSNLRAFTMTSQRSPKGGFINQNLFLFDGSPSGAFHLTGDLNQPFSLPVDAPADANFVAEFNLNAKALVEMIRNLAIDMMGPMGEGIINAQLVQPITPDGLTLQDIIDRLNTRVQVAIKPNLKAMEDGPVALALLNGQFAMRADNLGELLVSLAPILQGAGFTELTDPGQSGWKLSVPVEEFPITVYIQTVTDSNDLLITLSGGSKDWFLSSPEKIGSSAEFLAAIEGFPKSGLSLWYDDGTISSLQISNLKSGFEENPEMLPFMESIVGIMNNFTGKQAGVSFLEDDAYRVESWQTTSYKSQVALAGIALPMGILSAVPQLKQELSGEEDQAPDPDSPTE